MPHLKAKKYLIFAFLSILLLVGCSNNNTVSENVEKKGEETKQVEQTIQGGELIAALSSQPPTLDTHINTTSVSTEVGRNIFETLVTLDTNSGIHPMLADSWEQSEDGKTITFSLRKGVLFHNGQEMTADDVVASMNRWLKKSNTGQQTFQGAVFEVVDAYTVELKLAQPTSTALSVLAYSGGSLPGIMPAEIIQSAGDEEVEEFIGTGPFKFESWQKDQQIHLTKFTDYQSRTETPNGLAGKREALVDDLYFVFVPDSSTAMAGLQTGEYDIVYNIPYDSASQIMSNPNLKAETAPQTMLYLYFNKRNSFFENLVAREAIAIGINKEEMLQAAYSEPGFYMPNHNMMMYNQVGQWKTDLGKDEYNLTDEEEAKRLLKEAGYNGEEIIIMTSRDYEYMYNATVVLQAQLNKLGMNTKLEVYDWPTFVERRDDDTTYDLTIIPNTPKPEPTSLVFMTDTFTGWTDSPELDVLIEKIRLSPTLEDAQKLYDDLQAWYLEYKPVIKIGDGNKLFATRNTVSDIQYIDGMVLWNVSNAK